MGSDYDGVTPNPTDLRYEYGAMIPDFCHHTL
jgi:hypothetical protein